MKTLVIDTETTGLSPRFNQALTVGMLFVDVEKNFLKILDSKHILIKHKDYNISPMALRINKININEHQKTAIFPPIACQNINSFIEKNNLEQTPLLGHNINFDISFLNNLFLKANSQHKFYKEYIDTMHIWMHLKRKNVVSPFFRNNLQTLAEFFNIDCSKSHDALADCHITAKIYSKMLGMI